MLLGWYDPARTEKKLDNGNLVGERNDFKAKKEVLCEYVYFLEFRSTLAWLEMPAI